MNRVRKRTIGYCEIARIFLKTGSQSFGGWSTTALLLERELVSHRKYLSVQQLKSATAYAQILPGATQVAIVSNVGYQLRGIKGSLVAAISYLLPAVMLITIFTVSYFHFAGSMNIVKHLDGLVAALSGIILANAYKIGSKHADRSVLWLLVGLAFSMQYWLHIHALITIIVFGGSGLVYHYVRKKWVIR